jgi:valyl-tRNA synthetase
MDNRIQEARSTLESLFSEFKLSEALKTLYSLIWDDFCNWYLEWVKPPFGEPIDARTYEHTLGFFQQLIQLLHPFMPFITEEIYHLLANRTDDLCVLPYPAIRSADPVALEQGAILKEAVTTVRDARNKAQLKPKDQIDLFIESSSERSKATYKRIWPILARQVNAQFGFIERPIPGALTVVCGKDKMYIVASKTLDDDKQKEDLQKELVYLKGFLDSVNKKLNNDRFVQNAKPDVVELERKKKADTEDKIRVVQESLINLIVK